jgi:hypothetical protein
MLCNNTWDRDSSVGTATGYELNAWVLSPGVARDFYVLHNVHTGSDAHPASYIIRIGAVSPGGGEDYLSPSSSADVKNGGAITPLSHISS